MAREHARILSRIWTDELFCARSAMAQRLYLLMISQASVNNAGVLPLTIRRWAQKAPDTEPEDVETSLMELESTLFVIVDHDTEEVLIRSFMRNDGVAKQPKVLINACNVARQVESATIREQLAVELRRIGTDRTLEAADVLDPRRVARPLSLTNSPGEPDAKPRDSRGEAHATGNGVGEGVGVEGKGSRSVDGHPSSADADAAAKEDQPREPSRPDVDRLCDQLADYVEENGETRPRITKGWRDAARLLIDRDGRTVDAALQVMEWTMQDEFWHTNILSMPTFRKQYATLRLKARAEWKQKHGGSSNGKSATSDERAGGALALADWYAQQENEQQQMLGTG